MRREAGMIIILAVLATVLVIASWSTFYEGLRHHSIRQK
jgi:hypothetical protein